MSVVGLLSALRRDTGGVAMLEFAFSAPLVVAIGLYATEISNFALMQMRVSQAALNLADNASRVGVDASTGSTQQLREVDIIDVLDGLRKYSANWELTTRGRVTISSLESKNNEQRIHWQRCVGLKNGAGYDSSYGRTLKPNTNIYDPDAGVDTDLGTNDNSGQRPGTLAPNGMGETGAQVNAPNNSGVMFVEINYDYRPIVSASWLPGANQRIRYVASFVVRDNRDFSQIYNPSPREIAMTCDRYTR